MGDAMPKKTARPGLAVSSARAATMRDVAEHAGVSTASVSRALAEPERVRAALRGRVLESVRALEYSPNFAARSLRAGASRMILIDAPHHLSGAFFSDLIEGLDTAFTERGYTCIVGSTEHSPAKARRLIELAYAGQIDGAVVLNAEATRIDGRSLIDSKVPVVAICSELKGRKTPCVLIDDERWARRQVELLAALGHRDLLYVSGIADGYNEVRRRRGFKRAAAAAGIGEDRLSYAEGDYTPTSGVEAARAYVTKFPRPTGIVCASDDMAIGFMSFAAGAGMHCPADYSIIGFDGVETGRYWSPALTTIRQPRPELAKAGADLMLSALAGQPAPPDTRLVLECELILGGSTGAAPPLSAARRRRDR